MILQRSGEPPLSCQRDLLERALKINEQEYGPGLSNLLVWGELFSYSGVWIIPLKVLAESPMTTALGCSVDDTTGFRALAGRQSLPKAGSNLKVAGCLWRLYRIGLWGVRLSGFAWPRLPCCSAQA